MIGSHKKEYVSIVVYIVGVGLAFINPYLSIICFICVGLVWFLPDTRIEKKYK